MSKWPFWLVWLVLFLSAAGGIGLLIVAVALAIVTGNILFVGVPLAVLIILLGTYLAAMDITGR